MLAGAEKVGMAWDGPAFDGLVYGKGKSTAERPIFRLNLGFIDVLFPLVG